MQCNTCNKRGNHIAFHIFCFFFMFSNYSIKIGFLFPCKIAKYVKSISWSWGIPNISSIGLLTYISFWFSLKTPNVVIYLMHLLMVCPQRDDALLSAVFVVLYVMYAVKSDLFYWSSLTGTTTKDEAVGRFNVSLYTFSFQLISLVGVKANA